MKKTPGKESVMEPKPIPGGAARTVLRILLTAALGQGAASLLSVLFLKRLGAVVRLIGRAAMPGEPVIDTLARVFSALRNAAVVPRIFPAFFLFLTAAVLLRFGSGRSGSPDPAAAGKCGDPFRGGRALLAVLSAVAAVLLFLAAFLLTLWQTEVNGIRFGDVLLSLIRTVRSGALDSLCVIPAALPDMPEVIAL